MIVREKSECLFATFFTSSKRNNSYRNDESSLFFEMVYQARLSVKSVYQSADI